MADAGKKENGEKKEAGGLIEGAVNKLVSNLELLIRYFMTGVVICGAFLVSRADANDLICLAEAHPEAFGILVAIVGFLVFIMYRMVAWVILDGLFWKAKQSAPALFPTTSCLYDQPYAEFLLWRHSGKLPESLGGYLTYRWSVVHFVVVSTVSLIAAAIFKDPDSLVSRHVLGTGMAAGFFCLLALWQFWFLLRVERELCRKR